MLKQEANARVAALIATAQSNITEAMQLADEHGLHFYFSVPNHYGMQDSYTGKPIRQEEFRKEYGKFDWCEEEIDDINGRWNASSAYC